MNNQELEGYIHLMNKNEIPNLVQVRYLTKNICFVYLWDKKLTPYDNYMSHLNFAPNRFYFIKNSKGKFVSIVEESQSNLHWFTIPEHRKKGILKKALETVILKHLFRNRSEQRITIEKDKIGPLNYASSTILASKLGFERVSEYEYILKKSKIGSFDPVNGSNSELTQVRYDEILNEINFLSKSLYFIQTEVEQIKGNDEFSIKTKKVVDEIKKLLWVFEECNYK